MIKSEKVIVVDVDGTLTDNTNGENYVNVPPALRVVKRLIALKREGYWIILNSSRNMRTYNGNVGQIIKHAAPILIDWLARHGVPYDELHFGKPWCGHDGFYVDDRAIRPREFTDLSLDEIAGLLQRDKITHDPT